MADGTMTTRRVLSITACGIGAIAALMPVHARAGERWGGSVALTTDYRLRGISQSDESPAVQIDLHYDAASGWLAGLWASTIRRNRYQPTSGEVDALVGYRWAIDSDWSAKLTAVHYMYPWDSLAHSYDYDELIAATAYRDRAFLTVAYSPDAVPFPARWQAGRPAALSYELTLRLPLAASLFGSGGVGHYQLHDQQASSYWYWSAGLGYGLERLHFDLTYFGTSSIANSLFYDEVAGNRWAGTVTWSF